MHSKKYLTNLGKTKFLIFQRIKTEYFSQNTLVVLKKQNIKNMLKLKNANYEKKKNHSNLKYILQRKYDICVIKKNICTYIIRILCIQCNKNTVRNYKNCKKMLEKHKNTSK